MAERVVSVKLRAQVADYLAGMEKARKATAETGTEAEKLAQKGQAFDVLGKASLGLGIAAAAGVALAIAKYAEFDQAMSNVQAATQASAEDQAKLSAAALEAGATTVFSATESANAIEELSKAGLSTADVLGGALRGSLDLASAGQLGVARAAEISATALQQFNLKGSEAGHVADVLAAGAGKAMGSVDDLANALKFVGPVANSMGISLEETTGTLALFAQQGIIGEQAGTSLRGVLASLTSPSSIARKEIEKLGITLYDSQGGFLGLENAAGELSKAYGTMDDATRDASLGIIFGRETVTAATTLYQAGAEGVAEWTAAVDDSGYAAQVARDRLDNLAGDVEALGGAFDTALIQTGAAGNDVLRIMVQTLTDVVDLYNQAPDPVKATALAAGGLAAAVGLASGAFFLGAPRVAAFNASLATMGPNAQKAGAALTAAAGPVGLILAAAGVALAIFAGEQANAKARTDAFTDTLDKQNAALTDSTEDLVRANLSAEKSFLWMSRGSAFDAAEKLGISLDDVTEAALGNEDALKRISDAYDEINTGNVEQADAYKILRDSIDEQSASLTEAQRKTLQMNDAQTDSVDSAEASSKALEVLQGKAEDTGNSVDDLAAAIRGFADTTLSSRDAARALEESYDTLSASIEENGTSLKINSEEGRANQEAIDGIAQAAKESSAATLEQTGSQAKANEVMKAGRTRLIEMLGQFGITGAAAEAYADELGLIPDNVYTAAKITGVAEAKAILDNLAKNRTAIITAQIKQTGAAPGAVKSAYATGGTVYGPGSGTSDSIMAWLSNGEEVTRAAMAAKYRPLLKAINSDRVTAYLSANRLASGGTAGYVSQPQYAASFGGGSSADAAASFNVVLSAKGGVDLLRYVDVQIQQADNSRELNARRGRQVR